MRVLTPNAKYILDTPEHLEGKDSIDSQNVVRETWVENVYQINESDFGDSCIFVDIGANIGAVSLFVASMNDNRDPLKKKIKVFAVEPEPHNIGLLNKNIKNNSKQDDIRIVQLGLAGTKGKQNITNQGGNSSIVAPETPNSSVIETTTLEGLFEEFKISECDILKMDIEGWEYEVLLNSSDETLRKIKYLTLEFTGGYEEMFGLLMTRLAEIFNLHVIGRPSTGGYIYGRRY